MQLHSAMMHSTHVYKNFKRGKKGREPRRSKRVTRNLSASGRKGG